MKPRLLVAMVVAVSSLGSRGGLADEQKLNDAPHFRHPAAIVAVDKLLFIANERSGSISVYDLVDHQLVEEAKVGQGLTDLASIPGKDTLLVCDQSANELIVLTYSDQHLQTVQRLSMPTTPVSVLVSEDGKIASVTSLWSRRVCLIDLEFQNSQPKAILRKVVDLPFAPRKQYLTPDAERLIVADSFGGRLAAIDTRQGELISFRTLGGHNIRGLATSHDGQELMITHQLLNDRVPTIRARVFWGAVVSNLVKSIRFDEFDPNPFGPKVPILDFYPIAHWSLLPLGEAGKASGDPGEIAVASSGAAVILLCGVDEVAVRNAANKSFVRLKVGDRPTDVAFSADERVAYVTNSFDDTVTVVDIEKMRVRKTFSLGPQPEQTIADRGERLFYDASLSLDGWYSCHGCHTDGHTCGLKNDNFGDESYGAPKSIPSLLGVGETEPWAWNGQQKTLQSQIHKSITVTMQGKEDAAKEDALDAIAAYLRTLPPPPSLDAARGAIDKLKVTRGRAVFRKTGCAECHRSPTYTTPEIYDVGLRDEVDYREFNPPSLRGVSQRNSFFHDNRAGTLQSVFDEFTHEGGGTLTPDELSELLSFLHSL